MMNVTKFSASWCQPCKALAPEFTKIKEMFNEITFIDVDVETEEELASMYGIRSVPTVIIEKNNKIVGRLTGLYPKQKYIDLIKEIQDSP